MEQIFEQLGEILNPNAVRSVNDTFTLLDKVLAQKRILIDGLDELTDILLTPGKINRDSLLKIISETLDKHNIHENPISQIHP